MEATCVDMETAARAAVARTFNPSRRADMTGRTFATWHRSPAFRTAFRAAWAERREARVDAAMAATAGEARA